MADAVLGELLNEAQRQPGAAKLQTLCDQLLRARSEDPRKVDTFITKSALSRTLAQVGRAFCAFSVCWPGWTDRTRLCGPRDDMPCGASMERAGCLCRDFCAAFQPAGSFPVLPALLQLLAHHSPSLYQGQKKDEKLIAFLGKYLRQAEDNLLKARGSRLAVASLVAH
jgi:hypothetical protein